MFYLPSLYVYKCATICLHDKLAFQPGPWSQPYKCTISLALLVSKIKTAVS